MIPRTMPLLIYQIGVVFVGLGILHIAGILGVFFFHHAEGWFLWRWYRPAVKP